jgi:hypothetical protein
MLLHAGIDGIDNDTTFNTFSFIFQSYMHFSKSFILANFSDVCLQKAQRVPCCLLQTVGLQIECKFLISESFDKEN